MDWWTEVRVALQSFLDQHGLLAGFVLILIEEAGIPVPIPGDFLMLLLGVHARQGQVALWQALLVMELATLIGAIGLYLVAARAGRGLVYRYGRYMHLTAERLDQAERWLRHHGMLAVVAGRLTPGLRMATVIASGVFGVPLWRFLPALALGSFLYILLYTLLGYFLGPPVLAAVEGIHLPLGLLGSLVPLVVLLVWIVRARQGLRLRAANAAGAVDHAHVLRDGAVSGALATIVSSLMMNVLLHVIGDAAVLAPGEIIERTQARLAAIAVARTLGPLLLLVAPAFILVGMLWGAGYGLWVEPRLTRLPDWLSGLVFGLLPLALGLLVVPPVVGAVLPEAGRIGLLVVASETVRHLVYGVVLGLTYPLRIGRHTSDGRAATPTHGIAAPSELRPAPGLG
ncbi:MAG: DedA family protein [Chloroflexota bacterium]|nr:DedA family protein [Chloroflexota bacterium]